MRYVFVSHANPDKPKIKPLIEALLDAGISLWIDRPEEIGLGERHLSCGRILSGKDWQQEIDAALEKCSCVLFLLSADSNSYERSDVLIREFEYGRDNEVLVIAQVGKIQFKELNPFFRVRQSINIFEDSADDESPILNGGKFDVLVDRLRRYLLTDPRHFKSGTALARQTAAGAATPRPYRPPRLMPYLADRQEQQKRFVEELQRHFDAKVKKPLFFLIYGSEPQCVDSFVEQLYCVKLREVLDANGLTTDIVQHTLHWPDVAAFSGTPDQQELSDHFHDLENQVRTCFGLRINADNALLQRKIRNLGSACFFTASLTLENWSAGNVGLLRQWLEFWASMELKDLAHPVVTVIGAVYAPGFFSRMLNGNKLRHLKRDIEQLRQDMSDNATIVELPELKDVRYEDVAQWIMNHVHDYDREVVRREIRKQFAGPLRIGRRRLSMYDTAAAVKTVLTDPKSQIVTT